MNQQADHDAGPRRFAPDWRLTLFAGVFLPLLLGLGAWQWQRAGAKQLQWEADARAAAQPVVDLATAPTGPEAEGRVLRFRGRYLALPRVLLDNRTHQGKAGYEVHAVAVPIAEPDAAALVNLGWVPWGADRDALPQIDLPQGPVIIEGVVRSVAVPMVFGDADGADREWPLRVQRIDMAALASRLEMALYPHVIDARVPTPGMQTPRPPRRNPEFGPDRHRAYALQWWGLALVLITGWVLASWRRGPHPEPEERT